MSPDPIVTDLFPTVPGVKSTGGVALNPPPPEILGKVNKMVADAMANIPPGERVLVGIATEHANGETNVNAALAIKAGNHVEISTYLGRTWGTPVAASVWTTGTVARIHF